MQLALPLTIDRWRCENRIVLPPMVTWAANQDGTVSEYNLQHYASFQGVGLVVVEATAVSPEGRLSARQIGAFADEHLPGLSRLADIIHARGALAAIQLHHAGGQTNSENTHGLPLLAPSAVTRGQVLPQAMSIADIERVQDDFAAAAKRAMQAGFDAIELHGAHGYLISQFLSPAMNLRQDEYGGSLENRARFALEVVEKVSAAVGASCLVYLRFGAADGLENGLTLAEGCQVAQWLVQSGVKMLHISSGVGGAPLINSKEDWSATLQLAANVKKIVDVPVIGVGGIIHPEQAEAALTTGLVDLIAVGRASLADPLWASKALGHKQAPINTCRACPRCGHFKHPFTCPARPREYELFNAKDDNHVASFFTTGTADRPNRPSLPTSG